MNYAIQVENLTKKYKDFTLDHISLDLPGGTILGLIGENGAGKSTFINSILGITDAQYTRLSIFGHDFSTHQKQIKQDIAAVFSNSHYDLAFTPSFLGKMLARVYHRWDQKQYLELLNRFQLPLNKKLKKFSTGMLAKLEFAAALSHHPRLLILDEATSGLDPVFRDEILELLREFTSDEEHTVLISSHITSDLDKIADYIAYIHEGRLLFMKTYDELREQYGIIRCGREFFDALDREDIAAYKKEAYSYRVLVKNRYALSRIFQDILIESASIEDIMLFYRKGESIK